MPSQRNVTHSTLTRINLFSFFCSVFLCRLRFTPKENPGCFRSSKKHKAPMKTMCLRMSSSVPHWHSCMLHIYLYSALQKEKENYTIFIIYDFYMCTECAVVCSANGLEVFSSSFFVACFACNHLTDENEANPRVEGGMATLTVSSKE